MVQLHQLKLDVFTQEKVCQQLNTYMEERQVGASRIYALFLLIKKILVFLASSESMRRREYIAPNTWNSWTCVDSICSDSNTRRKQLGQNRKLLGAEQCRNLTQGPSRTLPTADDLKMPALFGEKKETKKKVMKAHQTAPIITAGATASSSCASVQPLRADANELKPEELKKITQGCLEYLRNPSVRADGHYVAYLVTATLCL